MSEIASLKMVTGEELVVEIRSTNSREDGKIISYRVRRPHILQFQQMANGHLGLAFVPWTLSNPEIEILDIPAESVLVKFAPSDKVEKQYLQQTSSIQIASAI